MKKIPYGLRKAPKKEPWQYANTKRLTVKIPSEWIEGLQKIAEKLQDRYGETWDSYYLNRKKKLPVTLADVIRLAIMKQFMFPNQPIESMNLKPLRIRNL